MIDYIEIGATPSAEHCEQAGPEYDSSKAKRECRAYINQLRRIFGEEPYGAELMIKRYEHEFGAYHEVAVKYQDNYPNAIEYAYRIEGDSPETWDDEAKKELGLI